VDLFSSAISWHIFCVVLAAAPNQADLKDVEANYPGELSAKHAAIRDLNRRLKPIKLKVYRRTLTDITGK